MSDALMSPAVAGSCWAAAAGLLAHSARHLRSTARDDLAPLMGVLGAFVFAAQMINVAIPMTGSSGHIGGGLLLAVLLGPHAAVLVMASVLAVQALLFGDGGLLALGCNILNLGFFPAFIAYPWIYLPLSRRQAGTSRASAAAVAAAVAGLLLGAMGVVLQTTASGITALPFGTFTLLMVSIHLAIGLFEGLATAAVLAFVARTRPAAYMSMPAGPVPAWRQPQMVGLLVAAAVFGGVLSWFASPRPDGLEWSVDRTAGEGTPLADSSWHERSATLQARTAVMPDYAAPNRAESTGGDGGEDGGEAWPAVDADTSVAGLAGGLATLLAAVLIGRAARLGVRPASAGAA